MKSSIRNVFAFEDEPQYWKAAVREFPNKVPRFPNKEDAITFMENYCKYGSNPDEPNLTHSVTTFTSWGQVEKYVLPKIAEYDGRYPSILPSAVDCSENRFLLESTTISSKSGIEHDSESGEGLTLHPVFKYLKSRLDLPIHNRLSHVSTMNSFRYLYHHMRCGIYVKIRGNKVVIFAPFVNKDYTNNWSEVLNLECADGSMSSYYSAKRKVCREENIIDKQFWWANGNIICNEHTKPGAQGMEQITQWWGDHFLFQMKDLLAETCAHRGVPDCEFFLNKRDYPQLKFNAEKINKPVEPYGFIFDKDDRIPDEDVPLGRHLYKSYAPIL